MKIFYDSEVDALYLEFRPLKEGTAEARSLTEGIIGNYSPDGKIAGIEILDASSLFGEELRKIVFEIEGVPAGISH